jgi:hypothetical protein
MLSGDAMFFLPQVIEYAKGGGLRNPYYERTFAYSPAHDGRHIWHGFLYQLLMGGALHADTYPKLALAGAFLNAASVLLLAAALVGLFSEVPTVLQIGMFSAILIALGGFLLGLQGRPETLSIGLTSVAVWVGRVTRSFIGAGVLGAITGFSAITSPMPALLLALGIAIWWIMKYGFSQEILSRAIVAVTGALAALALGFAIYPYSPYEWVHGIMEHRRFLHRFAIWDNWRSWLVFSGHFFLGGIVVLGFASSLVLILRHTQGRLLERAAATALTILAMADLAYFSDISGWYVAAAITPLLAALALQVASPAQRGEHQHSRIFFLSWLWQFSAWRRSIRCCWALPAAPDGMAYH